MPEIIILTTNDIHISDINPRSRIDNFKESLFEKLEQIREASVKLKADALLIAGDLYNLKSPAKNSHALNIELIEFFRRFKCPVYMIPGNHDLTADSLDSLPEQPLGVLFASGSVRNLVQETLTKKGLSVSLVGVPYSREPDLKKIKVSPKGTADVQVCALHLYAGPKPGNIFKERIFGYEELSKIDADIFVIGHYHIDQGIDRVNDKHFINIGSLSRGSLSDENINHQPKFGIIKVTKDPHVNISVEIVPLKVKPPEEVFDLVKREDEKKELCEITKFVDKLITESSQNSAEKNVLNILGAMEMAQEVKDKVLFFLKEAETLKK